MITVFVLSVFLDVHSSCINLNNGAREILLPFKTCKNMVIGEGILASSVVTYDKLFLKNHKKLARFIYIAGIIAHTSAAIHNYRMKH